MINFLYTILLILHVMHLTTQHNINKSQNKIKQNILERAETKEETRNNIYLSRKYHQRTNTNKHKYATLHSIHTVSSLSI